MARILVTVIMALSIFLIGCNDKKAETVLIEGPPETIEPIKQLLDQEPEIAKSTLGEQYIVKIVPIPPKEKIDHKIRIIRPDSDTDFKIQIIDPSGNSLPPELAEKLKERIQEQMKEKPEKP